MSLKLVFLVAACVVVVKADPSAVDLVQDVYHSCLKDFSVSCVKPKALAWMSYVVDRPEIKVTEDLVIVQNGQAEEQRGMPEDVFDHFEDFLQTHELVVKVPEALRPDGPFSSMIPRSFDAAEVKVPLAATGRSSKLVKKVIVPFLLGLKFKTAVLVPLVLALIALKTWKALTLGLLSVVLTGALLIFKLSKPKVNYEVIHFPQHVEHHVEHPPVAAPVATGWEHPSGYARQFNAQEMAYNAYVN